MSIETLLPGGPVHWGVMLAQGWKGELAHVDPAEAWPTARDWAQTAERMGFHGVWMFDHFEPYPPGRSGPVLEAWTTLAALSQTTEKIAIGTLVSCAAYRNAELTARMAENLARVSGGRFCLGLGAGWNHHEFESLGMPFPTAPERADHLEAAIRACRGTQPQRSGSSGQEAAYSHGQRPLVLVGGEGEKRTLPAAAAYADLTSWQVGVNEFIRKSRMLSDLCEAAGRDPTAVRRTHATNFQLFDSEREFRRWRQSDDRGMSVHEVDAYIRDRGAFYGTADAIKQTIEEFQVAGCSGFMVFCNMAPSVQALEELASVCGYRFLTHQ